MLMSFAGTVTYTNSLDPDQCWQNITDNAWTGSNLFDFLIVFLKEFFERIHFEKKSDMQNYPVGKS